MDETMLLLQRATSGSLGSGDSTEFFAKNDAAFYGCVFFSSFFKDV
jgi:hypothetical protein